MVQELKAEKMSASGGSSQPAMNDLYMGNYRVRQTSDPLLPTDCATKAYVDNKTKNIYFLIYLIILAIILICPFFILFLIFLDL